MSTIEEILSKERHNSSVNVSALADFIYTPSIAREMQNLDLYKPHFHDLNVFNKSRIDLIKNSIKEHKQHYGLDRKERDKFYFLPYILKNSMAWPLTIHVTMFLSCLEMMGTETQQKEWAEKAFNFEIFGCYAQTQLGHGSDVQNLETTAIYNLENDTFTMNTPSVSATKFWPGDLGIWGTHAIVFAQLMIQGKNHGVHGFIVPVRDPNTFELLPGIDAGDIGPKFGFHSKDNGYLVMNNVVIPKRNMLRKFVSVSKTGQIKKKGDPKVSYATMMITRQVISNLIPRIYGQVIIIALRYSLFRTQFLNSEKVEISVINYQSQKEKVVCRLAEYIAICIGGNAVKDVSNRNLELVKQKNDFSLMSESHACLCLGKALFTEIAYEGIETCRKSCGGHGFSHYSGIPGLQLQFASNLTLQGENTIMYLQVTRYLLKNYKYAMTKKKNVGESVEYLLKASQFMEKRISQELFDWKKWTVDDIYTLLIQSATYSLSLVTEKMLNKPEGVSSLDVWNKTAGCDIKRAAVCHGYLYMFSLFKKAVQKNTCRANQELVSNLCMLFGTDAILKNSAPIIEGGFIQPDHLSSLRRFKEILLENIRPHIVKVCDAFNIPEQYIQSGLTQGDPYKNFLELARKNELNEQVQEGALYIRKHIQSAILKHQAKL